MTRRQRIGKHQLQQLALGLGRRDSKLVADVARFRLLSGTQLQRLHFGDADKDARTARRRLQALVDDGLLDRLPRRVGGRGSGSDAAVFRIGRAGKRLLEMSGGAGPAWQPSEIFAAHTLVVADSYVELVELDRLGRLELVEFTPEPTAWRQFVWQMNTVTLKPDALVIVKFNGLEHHYFLEVDLGTESMTVISNKISRYLDYYHSGPDVTVFPQVLFLVDAVSSYHCRGTDQRVQQITATAVASLGPDQQLVGAWGRSHPPWAERLSHVRDEDY